MAEPPVDLIFYNKVMDRIAMRQLISRLISHFGITYTTHVLDQLKTIGFQQATLGAISLGIDDLLTAPSKSWLIEDAEQYSNLSEKHQNVGNLHAVEKLRQLIETWYATSEYFKSSSYDVFLRCSWQYITSSSISRYERFNVRSSRTNY